MVSTNHLERFLAAAAKMFPESKLSGTSGTPFVTISRQAGAGGHALARALLDRTLEARPKALFEGWSLFDERLAEMVAENPALKVSLRGLAEEEFASDIQDMVSSWIGGLSPQSVVVAHLFKVIRGLAQQGKVIIVGRAGACLTRTLPLGVHLRLMAPLDVRVRRVRAVLGSSEKEARRVVADRDRARAALVKTYFHRDIDDPLLYDLVWNTDTVPVEVVASTTLRAVESLARRGREA
jgi:hypothetical protein